MPTQQITTESIPYTLVDEVRHPDGRGGWVTHRHAECGQHQPPCLHPHRWREVRRTKRRLRLSLRLSLRWSSGSSGSSGGEADEPGEAR
eukprot:1660784-Pyramimonas_sp.AAC.1